MNASPPVGVRREKGCLSLDSCLRVGVQMIGCPRRWE